MGKRVPTWIRRFLKKIRGEKPITSITFFKDFAKSKDFYKYFKELLNNELEGDEINFNLPSSHTSSSFK